MEDSEPVQLRHLRDILGAYARQVFGWYSIADESPTFTVERHRTDDDSITKYVARDADGVAAQVRLKVVLK